MASSAVPPSVRIQAADDPIIVTMRRLLQAREDGDVVSLAQGVVSWAPPECALVAAEQNVRASFASSYGNDDGDEELREAIRKKLDERNQLPYDDTYVMVTAGANQAFFNCAVALADSQSKAVLFAPYYFNHLMALQMTGVETVIGPSRLDDGSGAPDVQWLADTFKNHDDVRMVVLCNPCNPTGVVYDFDTLQAVSNLCKENGAWLVVDNTYEDFLYADGAFEAGHKCLADQHVVNIFSMSNGYGMMGWRVGYIAASMKDGGALSEELLKVQDTCPICANRLAQRAALAALTDKSAGPSWVRSNVEEVTRPNQQKVLAAVRAGGAPNVVGGAGAIYLMVNIPGSQDDMEFVKFMIKEYGVAVIPGVAHGMPGWIRVAYANVNAEICDEACRRLEAGMKAWAAL